MLNPLSKPDLSNWMIGGLIKSPAPTHLEESIWQLGDMSHTIQLDYYGSLFFTTPSYLDWAENESMIVAKLGFVRIGDDFVTASDLLNSGLITPAEVDYDRIRGNTLVFCFDKHQPQFCAYKTLLSVQQVFFTEIGDTLIIANNLRAITEFVKNKKINPKAIPLHFIFRSVPGRLTYFEDIFRLRPGEVFYRHGNCTKILLRTTLRTLLRDDRNTAQVEAESVDEFFNQIKSAMSSYMKATTGDVPHWTMLLSGGIDSSVLQMAINSQLTSQAAPVSHTFALDIEDFAPEIEYAKIASDLFGTKHTFVRLPTVDYLNWLTKTILILGQPPHHESTPCLPPFFDYIAKNDTNIKYLFSGQGSDALHGVQIAEVIARYQNWPLPLLRVLEAVLKPISQSKSDGARRVADTLRHLRNQDSHHYPPNTLSSYTDWPLVYRSFGSTDVSEALAYRRNMEIEYLDSPDIIEKTHTVVLLSDAFDTASFEYQLSLAYDKQVIFPFLDDALISATFKFDAQQRFFMDGRTKPILKQILEMGPASSITKASKRGGGFAKNLYNWMQNGVLRDVVHDMIRPSFLSQDDFQRKIQSPDWFTWNLLTFDLFEKKVVL